MTGIGNVNNVSYVYWYGSVSMIMDCVIDYNQDKVLGRNHCMHPIVVFIVLFLSLLSYCELKLAQMHEKQL